MTVGAVLIDLDARVMHVANGPPCSNEYVAFSRPTSALRLLRRISIVASCSAGALQVLTSPSAPAYGSRGRSRRDAV